MSWVLSKVIQRPYSIIKEKAMAPHSSTLAWKILAWQAAVHGVAKSQTWLSDFTFTSHGHALEKEMATHSGVLAWRIPETVGPRLWGCRVGHDWATSLSLFTFMHWRRKWQHTPVFLPGESQGWGSLVGCRLWGHTKSDTTEVTQQQQQQSVRCSD